MERVEDIFPFEYEAINGVPSRCRVRIYKEAGERPVVLITEPGPIRNPGHWALPESIEIIVGRVWAKYFPGLGTLPIIVEHLPAWLRDHPQGRETFSFVHFRRADRKKIEGPSWEKVSKERVEQLIGQEIPQATPLWVAYTEIIERLAELDGLLASGEMRRDEPRYHQLQGQRDALAWVARVFEIDRENIKGHY
jgi:hypothetical protein